MKRKWIIAGAVVLVVAGALPWGVGYLTEYQWQQATTEVNDAQPFMHMETSDYRRGILGSDIQLAVVIANPETGDSHRYRLHADVSHGVTGSLIHLRPVDGWSPADANWFAGKEPKLTLETRVWGTATLTFDVPATRIRNPESGESVTLSPGTAKLEFSDQGQEVHAFAQVSDVTLTNGDAELRFSGVHLQQIMEHLSGEVWTGNGELSLASMSLSPKTGASVSLEGLRIASSSESRDDGARLDSRMDVNLKSVSSEAGAYGPHRLVVALNDLDVASWDAFTSGLSSLQEVSQSDAGTPDMEQQMAAIQQMNGALRDLAAAGFEFAIPELSIATPEGEVKGTMSVRHPELSGDDRSGMLLVMQRLTGTMHFGLPLSLVENYPEIRMQAAPMIKQGLLVEKGERLVMDATLNDMVVKVNKDIEVPLPPVL